MFESFRCGHLSNLESLFLVCGTEISEECPKYVMSSISEAVEEGHLSALNALSVEGYIWKDEDMKSLLQCLIPRISLKCLCLTGVGDGCAEVLGMNMEAGHLGNLEVLQIHHSFNAERSFRNRFKCSRLANGLRTGCVKKLQRLSLGIDIAGDGLDILSFAVREGSIPQLRSLELSLFRFFSVEEQSDPSSPNGIQAMAEGLASPFLSYLESLELVGRRGQLADIMSTLASWNFRALKTLRLVNLGLTEKEAIMLAKVLSDSHFPALQCLDLADNGLGATGYKALFQAFKSDKVADLEGFAFSGDGDLSISMCELAEVLLDGHLPKLKYVAVEYLPINQEAAEALVHAYQNNPFLTVELDLVWPVGPWVDNWKGFYSRNRGQVEDLRKLDGARVSAKQGRVFLCGEPCAGKTTLRKSLSKRHTLEAWCSVARRLCLSAPAEDEPRTRGIEVVQIADEEVTLTLWDLAGQREYHVLHGAFFPDLAYTDVYATIFVVVCRANPETSSPQEKSYEDLRYWLRFIAASSLRGVEGMKRQVIVVLNRFDNMQCDDDTRTLWKSWVEDFRNVFKDFLEITFEMDSCCLDVRASKRVEHVKTMMFQKTKGILKGKQIPKVCETLQSSFQQWVAAEAHKVFPVLDYNDIQRQVKGWGRGVVELSDDTLVAAINYLNQVGAVIHISDDNRGGRGLSGSDLIVVKPEWFCRDVVGDLLLPEELWGRGEVILRHKIRKDDYTLAISILKGYYTELTDAQVSQAITILLRMGLCFAVDSTKVLIPALVPVNTPLPSWWTERRHGHDHDDQWVMGFSLIPVDAQRTLLPASFFFRFQVELAQETEIRQQVGNDFSVGLRFVAFKALGMKVLVEFRAEEKDTMTDRVDIMVKPSMPKTGTVVSGVRRGEPSLQKIDDDVSSRAQQVNFAYSLLEKLDGVVRRKCCPGVQFQRAVMKPWSARDGHHPMMKRNVDVLVDHLKKELASPDLKPETALTEWYVGGIRVRKADLLSERDLVHAAEELQRAVGTMREGIKVSLALVEALGASNLQRNSLPLPSPKLGRIHSMPGPGSIQMGGGFSGDAQLRFSLDLKAFVDMEARVQVLEMRAKEVKNEFQELRTEQTNIANQLRILEITFLEEKHNSVPRFVHFTESKCKDRIRLRDVLNVVTPCTLHLLCEARFENGELHEVENQKGFDVSRIKEWAKKYAKWIKWCITIFGAITSIGAAAIPGFGVLAPAICSGVTQIATSAIDQLKESAMITSSIEASLTAGKPIKDLAKLALEELLSDLKPSTFMEYFRLRRVRLLTAYRSSTQDHRDYVVWICEECFCEYKRNGTAEEI